jgi:hypothetical protein
MLKNVFILMMGILIITTIQANAMMGGHGSGRGGSGHYRYYGSTQGNMDYMMGTGAYGSRSSGNWRSTPWNRYMGMDQRTAGAMMGQYMQNHYTSDWRFGRQRDYSTYYLNDIIGSNGVVIYRLFIDKRSGTIHSFGLW